MNFILYLLFGDFRRFAFCADFFDYFELFLVSTVCFGHFNEVIDRQYKLSILLFDLIQLKTKALSLHKQLSAKWFTILNCFIVQVMVHFAGCVDGTFPSMMFFMSSSVALWVFLHSSVNIINISFSSSVTFCMKILHFEKKVLKNWT